MLTLSTASTAQAKRRRGIDKLNTLIADNASTTMAEIEPAF